MKLIVLDFESAYSQEYSLRKMTTVEYILDPRWETIGCAVKEGDEKSFWLEEHELIAYLKALPPEVAVLSHNALFDMSVLAWRFNYIPTLMIDTLGMARAWYGHKMRSLALASLAKYMGLGEKGTTVHNVIGMSKAAIKASGLWDSYASYSCNDADLCWQIFSEFMKQGFPSGEFAVMDTVLRACVAPRFVLDQNILAEHLHSVLTSKANLLARTGLENRDTLMSNDMFADALRGLGVDPPMKISGTTGKEAYAFAKTDPGLMDLEEHENADVQALVAARLGIKSTIEETRTQRLIAVSQLTWPGKEQSLLPVPLRYSGAHTHRLSGEWKLNLQNLGRGGKLRDAIQAPPGHKVVAVDASQIEARIAAWFCGATNMVQQFAAKEDVYSSFASRVFGYTVTKDTHKVERFIGKTATLGLQYGMGWEKFRRTVAMQSKAQIKVEVILSEDEAKKTVSTYRSIYSAIPRRWRALETMLGRMTQRGLSDQLHPISFEFEKIKLPSGLFLHYHDLENRDGQWMFTHAGKPKYVYGGLALENITQALARIQTMDAAVRIRKRLAARGLDKVIWLNLQVHDELVYVVPDALVEPFKALLLEEMRRRPTWGMDIPLDAEVEAGQSYGDAK